MFPVIYIGTNKEQAAHFRRLLDGALVAVPDIGAAARWLASHRGEPVIALCEKQDAGTDRLVIRFLKSKFTSCYIILVGKGLTQEERSAYLKAGVNNAIPPDADKESFKQILRFLVYNKEELFSPEHPSEYRYEYHIPLGKRIFDIVCSVSALIFLSPLLLLTAVAIRCESKGPIIYKSKRVGSNYQVFDFLKFRSMYMDADRKLKKFRDLNQYATVNDMPVGGPDLSGFDPGAVMLVSDDRILPEQEHRMNVTAETENAFVKFENDPRITRVGRFIRKYSIDELPQLINILKGDMSIVGNRPLPLYEAEKLTNDEYIGRFMCPAGLTGLWQVEKRGGAGKLSAEERKQLDIEYAERYNMWMDLKIILKTFIAFVQKENV